MQTYLLKPNDILFARTGGTVGKSFLVEDVPYDSIYAGYLIRTRYSNYLCPKYLKLFMESSVYWEQLKDSTIATAQPNCNGKKLSNMLLPIPPASEQLRIVSKMEELMPNINTYSMLQYSLEKLNSMTINNLKKSILQEAIKGKLVPQYKDEGTAKELLEKIKLEKQKLVEEGTLKKSALTDSLIYKGDDNKYYEKIKDSISEITTDYEFPKSWLVLKLKDICQLTDGEKKEENHICLDAKYLRGKSQGYYLCKGKFVHKGDIIILVDGENSGEFFPVPIDGYMGSTFKLLWISSTVYKPYILLFIQFFKDKLRNSKKGAAIPHLNKEIFYNLIIGIPPIKEQQRIVNQANTLFKVTK